MGKPDDYESEIRLEECLERNRLGYSHMSMPVAKLLSELTGIGGLDFLQNQGRSEINMCKAWDDHKEAGKQEGIVIGISQGITKGSAQTFIDNTESLIQALEVTLEKACSLLGKSAEDYRAAKELLK